jgi:hypothetical protein
MGKAWDDIKATFMAATRMGAKELAQALPALPDSIRPVEQLGMPGNPTQLEVNHEKGNDAAYKEFIQSRASDAREASNDDRGLEL